MRKTFFLISVLLAAFSCFAQNDSTENKVDSFLLHQKGLLGKLARNLVANKTLPANMPVRNDLLFEKYKGKIIRNITIKRLDFGTSLTDTSKRFRNTLTRLATDFHHKTREQVVHNNLFFRTGDKLVPYLIADNEQHLRDLPYLQDVRITVTDVSQDSVDVLVLTKDVLSIGGSYRMHNTTKMSLAVSEDNLAGTGDEFLLRSFFDNKRNPKFGDGGEYTARNIAGSFIDWDAGYLSFNKNFTTGAMNEEMVYTALERPLVNPYVKFTYAASAAWHATHDVYNKDTLYETNNRYRYYNYDGWVGWNTGAFKLSGDVNKDNRMRTLLSLRYLQQNFSQVPLKYTGQYYYQYADIKATLASVTLFQQDFYKAQYVYGFGVNEDIPEGADLSLITGWTKKSGVDRPYVGIDLERYFFSARESYFNYVLKVDGYLHHNQFEDVNMLLNLDYFSRLLHFGKRWQQRTFFTVSAAHQVNRSLNEPLLLESDFGVREWRNDTLVTGDTRITLKMESVFFTPWSLANFRFAPFVFVNLCRFNPLDRQFPHSDWYNSLGAGVRTRNESLIFQTMELRAFYFPQTNFLGERWRVEVNTNIRFRFNRQFEKKPDLVNVNVM
ncbi:MAG TPA: hypothetical protein VGI82_07320 [Chitinophagaceae bacterium]|jgi:hypothetical protein